MLRCDFRRPNASALPSHHLHKICAPWPMGRAQPDDRRICARLRAATAITAALKISPDRRGIAAPPASVGTSSRAKSQGIVSEQKRDIRLQLLAHRRTTVTSFSPKIVPWTERKTSEFRSISRNSGHLRPSNCADRPAEDHAAAPGEWRLICSTYSDGTVRNTLFSRIAVTVPGGKWSLSSLGKLESLAYRSAPLASCPLCAGLLVCSSVCSSRFIGLVGSRTVAQRAKL